MVYHLNIWIKSTGLFRGDAVDNSNFWEEFFLLRPKIAVLEVREAIN